jgi:hypothetical protein
MQSPDIAQADFEELDISAQHLLEKSSNLLLVPVGNSTKKTENISFEEMKEVVRLLELTARCKTRPEIKVERTVQAKPGTPKLNFKMPPPLKYPRKNKAT